MLVALSSEPVPQDMIDLICDIEDQASRAGRPRDQRVDWEAVEHLVDAAIRRGDITVSRGAEILGVTLRTWRDRALEIRDAGNPLATAHSAPPSEALLLPGHKCRMLARATPLMSGRDLWLGELTEPYPGFEHETHCLHVVTPHKSVVFGVIEADFDLVAVLGYIVSGRRGGWNETWLASRADAFEALASSDRDASPATPPPSEGLRICGDDSWDSRSICVRPAGHPITGPGLTDHEYQPKSMPIPCRCPITYHNLVQTCDECGHPLHGSPCPGRSLPTVLAPSDRDASPATPDARPVNTHHEGDGCGPSLAHVTALRAATPDASALRTARERDVLQEVGWRHAGHDLRLQPDLALICTHDGATLIGDLAALASGDTEPGGDGVTERSCLGCGLIREPSTWDATSHAYLCVECVGAIRVRHDPALVAQYLSDMFAGCVIPSFNRWDGPLLYAEEQVGATVKTPSGPNIGAWSDTMRGRVEKFCERLLMRVGAAAPHEDSDGRR